MQELSTPLRALTSLATVAKSDWGKTTSLTTLQNHFKSDAMDVWQGQQNNDTPLTAPLASVGCACTLKEANPASRQAKQPAGGGKDPSGGLLYKMQIYPRFSRFYLIFLIHSGWRGDAEPLKDTLFPRTTRNRRLCHYVFLFRLLQTWRVFTFSQRAQPKLNAAFTYCGKLPIEQ